MQHLKRSILFSVLASVLLLNGCTKGPNPNESTAIPNVSVNITINLNSSIYSALNTIGGVVYISGGYRGIMLYRLNTNTIMAYDRTCSYDLSDASGIVEEQTNGTAICLECGSSYSITSGSLITGPSTLGLKTYYTNFDVPLKTLTITN